MFILLIITLKYWIIFVNGKIFVGLGKPGEKCIAEMDDTLYNQIRPGQDKVSASSS